MEVSEIGMGRWIREEACPFENILSLIREKKLTQAEIHFDVVDKGGLVYKIVNSTEALLEKFEKR